MKRLDEIEARANAATGGPWAHTGDEDECGTILGAVKRKAGLIVQPHVIDLVDRQEDGDFIAHARTDVPAMVSALRAVLGLHAPYEVYEFDHMNGVWATSEDGEKVHTATLCSGCLSTQEVQDLDDCEWVASSDTVYHPCPTRAAATNALEGKKT